MLICNKISIVLFSILIFNCARNTDKELIGFYNIDAETSDWFRQNNDIYLMGTSVIISEDSIFLPIIARISDTTFRSKYDMSDEKYWTDLENQRILKDYAKITMRDRENARGTYKLQGNNSDTIVIFAPNHPLDGKYAFHIFPDSLYETASVICYLVVFKNDSTLLRCFRNKQ